MPYKLLGIRYFIAATENGLRPNLSLAHSCLAQLWLPCNLGLMDFLLTLSKENKGKKQYKSYTMKGLFSYSIRKYCCCFFSLIFPFLLTQGDIIHVFFCFAFFMWNISWGSFQVGRDNFLIPALQLLSCMCIAQLI